MDRDHFRDLLLRTRDELALADQHPADAATDSEMRALDVSTEMLFERRHTASRTP